MIDAYGLRMYTTGMGGKGAVMYAPRRLRDYRDYAGVDGGVGIDKELSYLSWLFQVTEGVFMTPGYDEQWTLSVQHTDEDVLRYINSFETFAREVTDRTAEAAPAAAPAAGIAAGFDHLPEDVPQG